MVLEVLLGKEEECWRERVLIREWLCSAICTSFFFYSGVGGPCHLEFMRPIDKEYRERGGSGGGVGWFVWSFGGACGAFIVFVVLLCGLCKWIILNHESA
jgi:hypothetical protein